MACVKGRATRTAFGHRGLDRGTKPGECLHMDTYQVKVDRDGRMVTEYGLVMKDLYSEHMWHAKVQTKDQVAEAVIQRRAASGDAVRLRGEAHLCRRRHGVHQRR